MFNLKNILKTKYIYESKELVNNSSFIYNKNNIGMYFLVKEKMSYTTFRYINIVSIICNVICLWTELGKTQLILSTILELVFLILSLTFYFLYTYFFKNYKIKYLECKNSISDKTLIFIILPDSNKLLTNDEFIKEYPKLNK
mgnify:FL=1